MQRPRLFGFRNWGLPSRGVSCSCGPIATPPPFARPSRGPGGYPAGAGRESEVMRLLDRYIARECLKILCLCLAVFVGVYVIVDLFEKFSKFLEARVGPALIMRYYLFSLPNFFLQVLPVGVLLASLLTLGGLARHNEVL